MTKNRGNGRKISQFWEGLKKLAKNLTILFFYCIPCIVALVTILGANSIRIHESAGAIWEYIEYAQTHEDMKPASDDLVKNDIIYRNLFEFIKKKKTSQSLSLLPGVTHWHILRLDEEFRKQLEEKYGFLNPEEIVRLLHTYA